MAKASKRLITFYTTRGNKWHMMCTRTFKQCLKMGFRHIFKRHAIAFFIKKV